MKQDFSLDDKYTRTAGPIAITGIQALVRLPLEQWRLDHAAGLRTGTFITGYQGSPLGEYDKQLARAESILKPRNILWKPGINEEVAVTSLYGAQLLELFPHEQYDGVVSIWYGKSPGIDRSGDALRHANFSGIGKFGAAVALAGDDTACKSSTIPGDSTITLYDLALPVLYPGDPIEIIEYGLHAIAMSRYTGLWTALKIVTNVADGGGVFQIEPLARPLLPQLEIEGRPFVKHQDHRLLPPYSLEMERQIYEERMIASLAYARENNLDRITVCGTSDRIGLIAAGKTYRDLLHALDLLDLDTEALERFGIRLYKLGLVAPIEPDQLRAFASGLDEILVVEEKRGFIETQVRDALYNLSVRPRVFGKRDGRGEKLFPSFSDLNADQIATVLAGYLDKFFVSTRFRDQTASLQAISKRDYDEVMSRIPYFCSGCPHNKSTALIDGEEHAGGGIGCHAMATWMDRGIVWLPQMGGEGAPWIGLSPFTDKQHIFQNVGDGTFAHSASKALEACIAANVNITYRILFNAAVAMTGGQEVVGLGTPIAIARQLEAHGVKRVVIVAEDISRFQSKEPGKNIQVRPREEYEAVMRELRELHGVTVIIYDQQCAAEKRRERKRGLQSEPRQRVYINESVCEGCGDCGVKSNCLSVVPVDTPYGRKTAIHQSSCNLDYSCLDGDCPAFMTVELGKQTSAVEPTLSKVSMPALSQPKSKINSQAYHKIMLVGIGGTGVVTVDALLNTAALLDGKHAVHLDQTGMSQKGGAVVSNFIVSDKPIRHANRIASGEADLVLAFDLVATVSPENLRRLSSERSAVVANTVRFSTAQAVTDVSTTMPSLESLRKHLEPYIRDEESHWIDAELICNHLFGSTVASNVFLLGVAYQAGHVPLTADSIEAAIKANGVDSDKNIEAFRWGRVSISDSAMLKAQIAPKQPVGEVARERLERHAPKLVSAFDNMIESSVTFNSMRDTLASRLADLLLFQGDKTAQDFLRFVDYVAKAEKLRAPRSQGLAEAVARGLFKLTAIKDEYECARLWLQDPLYESVLAEFDGKVKRRVHLHPPFLRRLGMQRKIRIGSWVIPMFRILYGMRWLRGTPLDVFAYTAHRRREHSLAPWYRGIIEQAIVSLDDGNHDIVYKIALLPDQIRGYESTKELGINTAQIEAERLLEKLRAPNESSERL